MKIDTKSVIHLLGLRTQLKDQYRECVAYRPKYFSFTSSNYWTWQGTKIRILTASLILFAIESAILSSMFTIAGGLVLGLLVTLMAQVWCLLIFIRQRLQLMPLLAPAGVVSHTAVAEMNLSIQTFESILFHVLKDRTRKEGRIKLMLIENEVRFRSSTLVGLGWGEKISIKWLDLGSNKTAIKLASNSFFPIGLNDHGANFCQIVALIKDFEYEIDLLVRKGNTGLIAVS